MRDELDFVLQVLVSNQVTQRHNCIWVLVECNDLHVGRVGSLCCIQRSVDEGSAAGTKVQDNDFRLFYRHLGVFLILRCPQVCSLQESPVCKFVFKRFEACLFVQLILDFVVFKDLVSL